MKIKKEYDESPQAFCLFNKNSEMISVNGAKYHVPLATIISEISLLPDSCFDRFDSYCARVEAAIQDGAHPQIVADLVRQMSIISESDLINSLCLFLPAYNLYMITLESLKEVDFSSHELAALQASIVDSSGNPDLKKHTEKIEYKNNRNDDIHDIQGKNQSHYQWIMVLDNAVDFTALGQDYFRVYDFPYSMRAYTLEARKMIIGLKRIRDDLNSSVFDLDVSLDFYRGLTSSARVFDAASPLSPFGSVKPSATVYTALSFFSLVSLELIHLHRRKKSLSRCSFCGRFFSPYNSKSKYCSYPNPLHGGKCCSEVAPHIDFVNREVSTPFGKEYRKNYTSYNRWVSRNWQPLENNFLGKIRTYLNEDYDCPTQNRKQYANQIIKQIQDEINNNFNLWNKQAQAAQVFFSKGIIEADECRAAIQIPPVQSRSPLLRKWYYDAKID